jgi:alpha-D-xyloside xylohydrolase
MNTSKRPYLLNSAVDVSSDFAAVENEYFMADRLTQFDPASGQGFLEWQRHGLALDWAFNKLGLKFVRLPGKEIPQEDYAIDPSCSIEIQFISARTIRLKLATSKIPADQEPSLMLDGEPPTDPNWQRTETDQTYIFHSSAGNVHLTRDPWNLEFYDSTGKLLTKTLHHGEQKALHTKSMPFAFMRRASDYSRSVAASFSLYADEMIFGCGESFTRLDKRGQRIVLWSTDAQSAASREMYKPVPFFMSSRGYGLFVHTSTPCTFDFGHDYDGASTLHVGDDALDLFIFMGSPKEILSEYTALTGRSPMPPLWSFGLWMSRLSYQSRQEVLETARHLREEHIPCDVIHIDAGWFAHGWRCDFQFSEKTFPKPKRMIEELRELGFRTSLWQLPYFTPENPLYGEIVSKKLYVPDGKGGIPTEDVILDFSNPAARDWYAEKIEGLLDLGVAVIKADFGECAPLNGVYHSGKTGFYEHHLYPLRYTRLLFELTRKKNKQALIWARAAWAGGQRYPVHWSGDPEITDYSMAATLRAGLSLGLSGFSFWSHDIGGFSGQPVEELYRRWMFFGMLTSHSRCHGLPPREPWHFSRSFMDDFRILSNLKYSLMPCLYTQAALSCREGFPLLRPLFFEYPDDPACWFIDNQYLLGEDILVAPFLEAKITARTVYFPPGRWIDYQDHRVYEGGNWYHLPSRRLPGLLFIKNGAIIPHISMAQSTAFMDWNTVELIVFAAEREQAHGRLVLADTDTLYDLTARKEKDRWIVEHASGSSNRSFSIKDFRNHEPF